MPPTREIEALAVFVGGGLHVGRSEHGQGLRRFRSCQTERKDQAENEVQDEGHQSERRALSFFNCTSRPTWLAKHKKYDSREHHGDAKGGHQDTPLPQRAETSD
jgi:hypothetical protein